MSCSILPHAGRRKGPPALRLASADRQAVPSNGSHGFTRRRSCPSTNRLHHIRFLMPESTRLPCHLDR